MRPLKSWLIDLNSSIEAFRLNHFIFIRFFLALIVLETFAEFSIDESFARTTSVTFFNTIQHKKFLQEFFVNTILSSASAHFSFLAVSSVVILLYALGIGGLWIVGLAFSLEWVFRLIHSGNLYGHEGALLQFLLLLVFIEFGQGRMKMHLRKPHVWKKSLISGLASLLFHLQILCVYVFAGASKLLSPEWNNTEVIRKILLNANYQPTDADALLTNVSVATALVFLIKLFQVGFPLLYFNKKVKKLILGFGVLFHAAIAIKISIYFFSLFMIVLYLTFVDESFVQNSPEKRSV